MTVVSDLRPERLDATAARELIASGSLTATGLARACLDRVRERDDLVRAWTHLNSELVLDQARRADAATGPRGKLHGIPVGIKDNLTTRDMPTSYNSPHFQGHFPAVDAAAVSVLRQAGAVIFGKNDTVEFAVNGRRARTRNPHDTERTPGGSSSGSAAAVADYQVPLSIGTQTGGSVIRPAAYSGVWAMKPTWNVVPHEGIKVTAASMDTLGWFSRSAADLALLCDVFELDGGGFSIPGTLAGARVAVCRSPVWDQALPETRSAMDRGVKALRHAGAEVVDLELDPPFSELTSAHRIIMRSEMRSAFMPEWHQFGTALYPELVETLRNTDGASRADLRRAYDLAASCRARFDDLTASHDAVLTPSAPGVAPKGLENTGTAVFNRIWTLLHVPCVNVPGCTGPEGLPVGLTLTGARFSDRRVLAVAGFLDDALQRDRHGGTSIEAAP